MYVCLEKFDNSLCDGSVELFVSWLMLKNSYLSVGGNRLVTSQIHRYQILSSLGFPFHASPQDFKIGEGFHTLINGDLFFSPTNVGHHNPPPSRPSVLTDTLFFLQSMWDCPKSTPLGPTSLLAHRLVSTPFEKQRKG